MVLGLLFTTGWLAILHGQYHNVHPLSNMAKSPDNDADVSPHVQCLTVECFQACIDSSA